MTTKTPFQTRIDGMSEADLVQNNTRAMKMLHGIWRRVSADICARAGDDRLCIDAIGAADAREIEAMLNVMHAKMDAFAAKYGGVPSPRAGDR